jgi:hypothetical protein
MKYLALGLALFCASPLVVSLHACNAGNATQLNACLSQPNVRNGTEAIVLTANISGGFYALENNADYVITTGGFDIAGTWTGGNGNTTVTADGTLIVNNNGGNPNVTQLNAAGSLQNLLAAPVELLFFSAADNRKGAVELRWATATEKNNAGFTLERAADGLHFAPLAEIAAKGNTQSTQYYSALDDQPLDGSNYYRLKQTDLDGQSSYSPLQRVDMRQALHISLAPQPAHDALRITLSQALPADALWRVFDFTGHLLRQGTLPAESLQGSADTQGLPRGHYLLQLDSGTTRLLKIFQQD